MQFSAAHIFAPEQYNLLHIRFVVTPSMTTDNSLIPACVRDNWMHSRRKCGSLVAFGSEKQS